jgi:c-di-GMP-binding flagellar brake protein YcgR
MADPAPRPDAPVTLPPAVVAPTHPMATPTANIGPAYEPMPLKLLKLRAGLFLQAQRLDNQRLVGAAPIYEAQYLGGIEGKALFLVPVGTFSIKTGMKAGDVFAVRGFTGVYDFQFEAKVIQAFDFTFREPAYAYAVLEYPQTVQARKVRNSLRIRTQIAATATPRNGQPPCDATLLDLSVDGALLRCPVDLGWVGELAHIAFSIGSDEDLAYIEALVRICHKRIDDEGVLVGLLFENLNERDKLRLREFVLDAVE